MLGTSRPREADRGLARPSEPWMHHGWSTNFGHGIKCVLRRKHHVTGKYSDFTSQPGEIIM